MNNSECQSAYSTLHNIYKALYDDPFPVRNVSSSYRNRKEWLSYRMKSCIKVNNRLLVYVYKCIDNVLLSQNRNNLRKSWSIMKEVIGKKRSVRVSDRISIDGNITINQKNIADKFNQYFTSVWPNLAQN